MTAQTILPANTLSSGGYDVANSVRMETNTYLTGSDKVTATSNKIGSFSFWIKRSGLGANAGGIIKVYDDANTGSYIGFKDDNTFFVEETNAGGTAIVNLITNAVYRDMSAWYHILVTFKTDDGTDSNRVKLYINGTQPSLGTATYPNENTNLLILGSANPKHEVGVNAGGASGKHYLAQLLHVDGTALSNTDVGEFDEDSGIWKPIDISETTLGNNGYYLSMEDSSNFGVATGKAFTANNLAAVDQSTDTCTNNFATLNPLDVNPSSAGDVFTEGNLKLVTNNNSNAAGSRSTIAVSSGKWYAEVKYTSATAWNGVAAMDVNFHTDSMGAATISWYQGRTLYVDGTNTANWGSVVTAGDIVGIALDMDNNRVTISQGGQWWDTDAFDAAAPTTYQNLTSGYDTWGFMCRSGSAASTSEWNFGAPMFTGTDEADGDGFGNFEFAVPSGYFSWCTKNLAEYG